MVRRRRSVRLLLLALTVLSPLALYSSRLSPALSPFHTRSFPGEITSQFRGVNANKLNALPLETLSSMKEPVGIVFSEERGELAKESSESESQELPLRKGGQHKNRGLSEVRAAADGSKKDGGVIEQVTTREEQVDGLARSVPDEQEKSFGSQQQSSAKGSLPETMPKQRSPKVIMENSRVVQTDSSTKSIVSPDARIRNIKDQLIKAKVYLGLGSIRSNSQYLKDLRQRIREVQKVLGDASKDSDLPKKCGWTNYHDPSCQSVPSKTELVRKNRIGYKQAVRKLNVAGYNKKQSC